MAMGAYYDMCATQDPQEVARIRKAGLRIRLGVDAQNVNPEDDPRFRRYWEHYQKLMGRNGVTPDMAKAAVRRSNESLDLLGVLGEVPQPGADRAPRRVDAGDDEQADVAELEIPVDGLALDLGIGDEGEHVVARMLEPFTEHLIDVGGHLDHDLHANGVVARPSARHCVMPPARNRAACPRARSDFATGNS